MRLKELPVERRNRIVSRHKSGEGYQNISAALKVPKNTVSSIILKWKKFRTTKMVVTLTELQSSTVEGRTTISALHRIRPL
jgi:hypothetical protein